MNEGVVIQLVDFKKFFDSERLRAVMASLNSANVNNKAYRCWFNLKATTVISWNGEKEKVGSFNFHPGGRSRVDFHPAVDFHPEGRSGVDYQPGQEQEDQQKE